MLNLDDLILLAFAMALYEKRVEDEIGFRELAAGRGLPQQEGDGDRDVRGGSGEDRQRRESGWIAKP